MVNPGKEVLDDLCMRFVLNCPEEELRSWERLLFQVEQAHWFYEDHVRPENTQLRSFSLKDFVKTLFTTCSVLKPYKAQVADILNIPVGTVKSRLHGAVRAFGELWGEESEA